MRSMPISSRCASGDSRIRRHKLIRSSAMFAWVMRQSTHWEPIRVTKVTAQRATNKAIVTADDPLGA